MSDLFVRLNINSSEATFFGPGTFQAKEKIKSLGRARWVSTEKAWRVKLETVDEDQLLSLFPEIVDIEIVEEESNSEQKVSSDKTSLPGLPAGVSVSQLLAKAQYAISQAFAVSIYVYGVLGKVTHSNSRIFMDLVDPELQTESINCVIWSDAENLTKSLRDAGFNLEAELQVMFQVSVRLDKRGRISLTVERIVHEYTIGKIAALREKTNSRLKEEGLFLKNKKLELAFLPRRLGIITSSAGTVIHDFKSSLDQANFAFELLWLPVSVQGMSAKAEIVSAIEKLSELELDAILIFRGGGSPAELAVFSEYDVARAVCLTKIPVISAIGHQEDQCSTQDVSFLALGVPKDIGRYFADIVIDYRKRLSDSSKLIHRIASALFSSYEEKVSIYVRTLLVSVSRFLKLKEDESNAFYQRLPLLVRAKTEKAEKNLLHLLSPVVFFAERLLEKRKEEFNFNLKITSRNIATVIERREHKLNRFSQRVSDAAPEKQLKRGFAIIRKDSTDLVIRAAELQKGEKVQIEFYDNKKDAIVS